MSTRIARNPANDDILFAHSLLGSEFHANVASNAVISECARELVYTWADFEAELNSIPIVQQIENGNVTLDEYKKLLKNFRAQVIDGSAWITRAASSFDAADPLMGMVRQRLIQHAAQESADYTMLEADYLSCGGQPQEIQTQAQNIATLAFSSFMFWQASQPNPLHIFGAQFIIEGMGKVKASHWAKKIQTSLGLTEKQTTFLSYHGEADQQHFGAGIKMLMMLPAFTESVAKKLVRTAKATAMLYAAQIRHLDDI
ncbi:MAG TPA: iron-containing redox enzyme family protein [Pseudomonadales bacterium]|nr:iron-containing redox enzyme family protein [Pseudomonadales bacterium]